VKDDKKMTIERLKEVREICNKHKPPTDFQFRLDHVSLSVYENRSQESIIVEKVLNLNKQHEYRGSPATLAIQTNEESDANYLKEGNRSTHYRKPCIGMSLIHRLANSEHFNMSLKPMDRYKSNPNIDEKTNDRLTATASPIPVHRQGDTNDSESDIFDLSLKLNKQKSVDNYGYTAYDNESNVQSNQSDEERSYKLYDMPSWIAAFLDELPKDLYDIFDPKSFHVTVRALRG